MERCSALRCGFGRCGARHPVWGVGRRKGGGGWGRRRPDGTSPFLARVKLTVCHLLGVVMVIYLLLGCRDSAYRPPTTSDRGTDHKRPIQLARMSRSGCLGVVCPLSSSSVRLPSRDGLCQQNDAVLFGCLRPKHTRRFPNRRPQNVTCPVCFCWSSGCVDIRGRQ